MNVTSWWIAMRKPFALGLSVAIVVSALLWGYVATRASEYQARFTLVAVPAQKAHQVQTDLASVASLTMPGLTDLARSPSVLTRVASRVQGAPSVDELAGEITVELIPASGVARITVRNGDRQRALSLATGLSHQIQQLDLLEPAGNLRAFGPSASSIRKVSPDLQLGKGFSVVAGILVGLIVATLASLAAPRLIGRRQVARILSGRKIPVLTYSSQRDDIRRWFSDPGYSIDPVAESAVEAASHVESALDRPKAAEYLDATAGTPKQVLLVAALGRTTADELLERCALNDAVRTEIVGVVLV